MLDDLIDQLAETDHAPAGEEATRAFTEACLRVDADPREQQRIRDIADLAEADDFIYGQAVAAVDRGDHAAALPLLRRCVNAGIGEADWHLAVVLDKLGDPEAAEWYARAAAEGDLRAAEWLDRHKASTHETPAQDVSRSNRCISSHLDLPAPDPDSSPHHLNRISLPEATPREVYMLMRDEMHLYDSQAQPSPVENIRWLLTHNRADDLLLALHDNRPAVALEYKLLNARLCAIFDCHREVLSARGLTLRLSWMDPARTRILDVSPLLSTCTDAVPRVGYGQAAMNYMHRRGHPVGTEQAASDVMLPLSAVPSCAPDITVDNALDRMLQSQADALLVMDESSVAGVVTLADVAGSMHQNRGMPSIQRVGTLMQPCATVPADMPLTAVMTAAAGNRAGLLIVTGPDREPAGYLTSETLLAQSPAAAQPPKDRRQEETRSRLVVPGGKSLLHAISGC